jgi:type I restriction enzyme M protein
MNNKRLSSPQSVNAAVKSICDIMRRSNCAGALQYVPELTWILFLRILDERETREAEEAKALGVRFMPSLTMPFRWQDWAAPDGNEGQRLFVCDRIPVGNLGRGLGLFCKSPDGKDCLCHD